MFLVYFVLLLTKLNIDIKDAVSDTKLATEFQHDVSGYRRTHNAKKGGHSRIKRTQLEIIPPIKSFYNSTYGVRLSKHRYSHRNFQTVGSLYKKVYRFIPGMF